MLNALRRYFFKRKWLRLQMQKMWQLELERVAFKRIVINYTQEVGLNSKEKRDEEKKLRGLEKRQEKAYSAERNKKIKVVKANIKGYADLIEMIHKDIKEAKNTVYSIEVEISAMKKKIAIIKEWDGKVDPAAGTLNRHIPMFETDSATFGETREPAAKDENP